MQILISGVDFTPWYTSATLGIQERTGSERTVASFTIEGLDLPFAPVEEQECFVWDSDLQRLRFAAGRIRRVSQEHIGVAHPLDGWRYVIEVAGWARDLERRLSTAQYEAKTTGFIAREVGRLASGVDVASVTTGGLVLARFETRAERAPAVLDRLAQQEGRVWWVDLDRRLRFELPGDSPAPFEVNEGNWRELFASSLTVEPETAQLCNKLTLFYKGKYDTGAANVFNSSNAVTGVGTLWTQRVRPGAKFRLAGSTDKAYTVEAVLSDTSLRLSSNYQEATASAQAYVLEDIPGIVKRSDAASIATLAALLGDDGVFEDSAEGPGSFLSYEEAREYAGGILADRAWPKVNVRGKTNSLLLPPGTALHAGMAVPFDLPDSYRLQSALQLTSLTKRDRGGVAPDGWPVMDVDLTFETSLNRLASKFRQIDNRIAALNDDGAAFEVILDAAELVRARELAAINTPLVVTEESSAGDAVGLDDQVGWGPFVWAPSIRAWDSQADWATWSGVGAQFTATAGGALEMEAALLAGESLGPWVVQYSPNLGKSVEFVATVPPGTLCELAWQSADVQGAPSAWFANLAEVPDAKYLRARLSYQRPTLGTTTPSVGRLAFRPDRSELTWGESAWALSPYVVEGGAAWAAWAHASTVATATGLQLAGVATSGTATGPWRRATTRSVAQAVALVSTVPAGATIVVEHRASRDGLDATATPWTTDLASLPDWGWLQHRATLTRTSTGPTLQRLEVSPP